MSSAMGPLMDPPTGPADAAILAGHPHFASRDAEEVRKQVARVFCEHEFGVVGTGQSLDTRLYYRPLGCIGLGRLSYGAAVDIDPGALDRFHLMQWPLRGAETIYASRSEVNSSPELGSLVSPGQRFHMRHGSGAEKLFVRVERDALERLAEQMAPGHARPGICFEPALPLTAPALASLRHMLDWLFLEASRGTLLDQPLLSARIEEALLLTMLQVLPHNQPQLLGGRTAIAPGFVIRAEEFMSSQAHEPLTVSRIATHVGVSIRSLYAGFQRYRGRSPMEHLRSIRLERARADLIHPNDTESSVTEIALRWGFGHLGQFAADYRRRFGELPSQSLRRARGR